MATMEERRARMVADQLARRGIRDPAVLDAFARVPREEFVDEDQRAYAYEDGPLGIGWGQTISQPYVVAMTVQALALQGHERVLEIGTGSGYAAAILGMLAREVVTIERISELAAIAAERLARLGFTNVHVHCADGTLGWQPAAPYEAIGARPARRARRARCSSSSRSAAASCSRTATRTRSTSHASSAATTSRSSRTTSARSASCRSSAPRAGHPRIPDLPDRRMRDALAMLLLTA
jgi:protein-L-isoaspartate(D-aspartate) O-methyltransferase